MINNSFTLFTNIAILRTIYARYTHGLYGCWICTPWTKPAEKVSLRVLLLITTSCSRARGRYAAG